MRNYSKKITKNKVTVYFYEDTHEYIDNLNNKYISVTTLIKNFFPEFDEIHQANEMHKRSGDSVELILNYWKMVRELAQEHGTNVHYGCECFIRGDKVQKYEKEKTNNCINSSIDFIKKQDIGKIISCEKLLFDFDDKIAGQCDLIFRDGDTLIIGDWKTNKKISIESFNNEKGIYPLHRYPNSDFYKYFIQLNTYLYLCIKNNFYPWAKNYKLAIFHIKENEVISMPLEVNTNLIKILIKKFKKLQK